MTKITIPQLDANLVDVTITHWNKKIGDTVSQGEGIAELTTDKAAYVLESPGTGTLLAIYAAEKSVVPTGYTVGMLGEAGEAVPASLPENDKLMASYAGPVAAPVAKHDRPRRVRATPRVRRIAQEKGIDLEKVLADTGAEVIDERVLDEWLASSGK